MNKKILSFVLFATLFVSAFAISACERDQQISREVLTGNGEVVQVDCVDCEQIKAELEIVQATRNEIQEQFSAEAAKFGPLGEELRNLEQNAEDLENAAQQVQLDLMNNQDAVLIGTLQRDAYDKAQEALSAQKALKAATEQFNTALADFEQYKILANRNAESYDNEIQQLQSKLENCLQYCKEVEPAPVVAVGQPLEGFVEVRDEVKKLTESYFDAILDTQLDRIRQQKIDLGELPDSGTYAANAEFKTSAGRLWYRDTYTIKLDWSGFKELGYGEVSLQQSTGQLSEGKLSVDGNFFVEQPKNVSYTEVFDGKFRFNQLEKLGYFEGTYGHQASGGEFELGTFQMSFPMQPLQVDLRYEVKEQSSGDLKPAAVSPKLDYGIRVQMGF